METRGVFLLIPYISLYIYTEGERVVAKKNFRLDELRILKNVSGATDVRVGRQGNAFAREKKCTGLHMVTGESRCKRNDAAFLLFFRPTPYPVTKFSRKKGEELLESKWQFAEVIDGNAVGKDATGCFRIHRNSARLHGDR